MVGEIVVNDQNVAPGVHIVLGHAGRGVGRNVGQSGRIVAFGHHDDCVRHCPFFLQDRNRFRHGRCALANGTVNTQHVLALLVEDGVDRDCGLAGLAVPQNQFPLAPADRDECVNNL